MPIYKLLSILLCYPEQELINSLPELKTLLNEHTNSAPFEPLLQQLATQDLIELQENYVQTFDRTPAHSLHLFEHIYGEDRARGQAMVDLLNEYQQAGFEITSDELPDYLPLFLEFLSRVDEQEAKSLLGSAVHVINHISNKLRISDSPYVAIFDALVQLSPIIPQALVEPPIHDMDEAMEKFGPSHDGVEPLLQNSIMNSLLSSAQAKTSYYQNSCHLDSNSKRESK